MAYSFVKLADNWSALSNAEKEALFNGTNYNSATVAELQSLGTFKVLALSDSASGSATSVKVNGVHNDFIVLPKNLFGTTFYKIKNMTVTESISDNTNAKIRYALTKDLVTYYSYINGSWTVISPYVDNVLSSGMSASDLVNISSNVWEEFYNGDEDENGLGLAFAFHETSTNQITAVDNLALTVDLKGSWNRAEHTVDYTYGYPTNNTLHVDLLASGSYKINYGTSAGSSYDLATEEDIHGLFG